MRTGSTSASLTILENDNPRGVFEFASVEHIYIHEHDSNYEIDIQRTRGSYERQFVEVRCTVVTSVRAGSLSVFFDAWHFYVTHFFFLGSSIFHLSLELLTKFWKMRLKVT